MANIFITRKCNLKCPYCFADEFVNKENEEITIENFNKAIKFIKTVPNERVGLIGGEPTLHSKFDEILDTIISDCDIRTSVLFTNGLEVDKHIDLIKNEKIHMLVNCNPPSDLGTIRYEKLKENLRLLVKEKNPEEFNLGINLYSPNMDYSFIFELTDIVGSKRLRFSTALPNTSKEETIDVLDSFRTMKPLLFSFFKDCLDKKIVPTNDCNSIPDCILTIEDKRLMLKLNTFAQDNPITTMHQCNPVIDILPDLNAVRCFGLSKYMKLPIERFKNIEHLRRYFYNKIDLYAKLAFSDSNCENCKTRLFDKCGICYTYKMKQCEKLKEYSLSII